MSVQNYTIILIYESDLGRLTQFAATAEFRAEKEKKFLHLSVLQKFNAQKMYLHYKTHFDFNFTEGLK